MVNINSKFQKDINSAQIKSIFTLNTVTVKTDKLWDNYYYACYFVVNGKVIDKRKYQQKHDFVFDLTDIQLSDTITIKYYFLDKLSRERDYKTINLTKRRKKHFFIDSELERLDNTKNCNLGEELLQKKILKLGVFPEYAFDIKNDFWEEDPFNNRSWQWRLHWFEFVNFLISYNYRNNDQDSLNLCRDLIESWLDKYMGRLTSFEFVWHDHATALRAEVLLSFLNYVEFYAKEWMHENYVFIERIQAFLLESKIKLSDESFYSLHTNHGLEQARVLLLLSIFFHDEIDQKLAINRLQSELLYSFTSEGVHKENSPGYHQFVLKVFLNIISKFPKNVLGDLSEQFEEIGSKALRFLAHITRPDGYLPIIGDTELIKPSDSYSVYFANDIEYQEYLYSSTLGRRGKKPREIFKVYEKSGYAIYRNQWGNKDDFNKTIQLILKAGCLSRYHHQQDEGHILLFAYGEDWLIDSGLYNYINSDPIRKYIRSRVAHNVPVIPGSLYHEDFTHRLSHWSLSSSVKDGIYKIISKNSVLKNTNHIREVLVNHVKNSDVKVIDKIITKNAGDIIFCWHIPHDKIVTALDNRQVEIKNKRGNRKLILTVDQEAEEIVIIKGALNAKPYSFISKKFGEVEESILIQVKYKLPLEPQESFSITTLFSFVNDEKLDSLKNNISILNQNKDENIIDSEVRAVEKEQYTYQVNHYGFKPYKVSLPIDWRINPYSNKNWQHHFMSLRWINHKALTEEQLYRVLMDFYNFHVKKKVNNPYYDQLRGDHTAAIRLGNLASFYLHYKDGLNIPLIGILIRLIRADIDNLQATKMYRAGHNHGLMVDISLLEVLANKEFFKFHNLINLEKILIRSKLTVDSMFYDDGFTKENSISYQEYNLGVVWDYYELINGMELLEIANIEEIINESHKVLGMSLTYDGEYFPLGDSYYQPKPKILNKVYSQGTDGEFKGDLYPYSSNNFIGYYFNKGLAIYKYEDLVHFSQTIMYGSNNHKQDDELSFCLNVKRKQFFVDAGYSVIQSEKDYNFMRSKEAHTGIIMDVPLIPIADIEEFNFMANFISYKNNELCYQFSHKRYLNFVISNLVNISNKKLSLSYEVSTDLDHNINHKAALQIVLSPEVSITVVNHSKILLKNNGVEIVLYIKKGLNKNILIENTKILDHFEKKIETKKIVLFLEENILDIDIFY